jgi:hypothetical protein
VVTSTLVRRHTTPRCGRPARRRGCRSATRPKGHTHLDVRYLIYSPDLDPDPGADESPFVRWFDWDEAIGLADGGLRGALVALRDQ